MTCLRSINRCAQTTYMSGWSRLITKVRLTSFKIVAIVLTFISPQEVIKHIAYGVAENFDMADPGGYSSSSMSSCSQLYPAASHQPFCLFICRQCNAVDDTCWLWSDWRIYPSIRGICSKPSSRDSIAPIPLTYSDRHGYVPASSLSVHHHGSRWSDFDAHSQNHGSQCARCGSCCVLNLDECRC